MENLERRTFMKGAGLGLLAFTVGSAKVLMTPGQARAQAVPFRLLNANEGAVIEALGETLVPGARQAGVACRSPGIAGHQVFERDRARGHT